MSATPTPPPPASPSATTCRACGGEHIGGAALCPRTGDPVGEGPCGTRIDRYDVETLLGAGGMGSVYRARHSLLGQAVALKLLRADVRRSPELGERFVREAQAVAQLGSPHIVRATDFGVSEGGQPFMVMELLEGRDLETTLREGGPLPVPRVVELAQKALAGLAVAHAAGVVHRDLKPANVFLVAGGGVKLLDFGVSKVRVKSEVSTLTRTGVIMGTPQFMAPEQFRGAKDVDHRADLYSAAVTIYQALAGALPFDATTYETLILQVCTEEPRPLRQVAAHVPEAVAKVIEKGMAREPGERWQSATEFSDALAKALRQVAMADTRALAATLPSGQRAPAPGVGPTLRPPPAGREATVAVRRAGGQRWFVVALVVAALVGAGGAVWFMGVGRGGAAGAGAGAGGTAGTDAAAAAAAAADAATDTAAATASATGTASDADAATGAATATGTAAASGTGTAAGRARPDAAPAPALAATDDPPDAAPLATAAAPDAGIAAVGRPRPSPRPAGAETIVVAEARIVGDLSGAPLRAAFRAARADLEECRPRGRRESVLLHFHVHTKISLAGPAPDNKGDAGTARCVAQRVKEHATPWPEGTSGIIEIGVTLEPR